MKVDLAVIGAGPAGMAAARRAAGLGLGVALVDEQAQPGGQVHRGGFAQSTVLATALEAGDAPAGIDVGTDDPRLIHLPLQTVIAVEAAAAGPVSLMLQDPRDQLRSLQAAQVILATGAQERPWAFPGWDLPGVMQLGAAQVLLKSSGLVPDGPVVIAGSGPLLYLAALQLHNAGAAIAALLETTPAENFSAALPHLPAALPQGAALLRGLRWLWRLRRLVPHRFVTELQAQGDQRLQYVQAGRIRIAARHLLVHQGVIPQLQLSRALGLAEAYDPLAQAFHPRLDADFRSSLPWLGFAGDGAGILGAEAAPLSGVLAALAAARALGRPVPEGEAAALRGALQRQRRLRRFLDALYAPAGWVAQPQADATLICRCEEVPLGAVRAAVRLGAAGANQLKAYTRCGMGACQGRICGALLGPVISGMRGCGPSEVAPLSARFPLRPVTLGALADLDAGAAAKE